MSLRKAHGMTTSIMLAGTLVLGNGEFSCLVNQGRLNSFLPPFFFLSSFLLTCCSFHSFISF